MTSRRHLLNSAVITAEGRFEYRRLSADEARAWLAAGPIDTDHVGYAETADVMAQLLGHRPAVARGMITTEPGDECLVFRLTVRLDDPRLKGGVGVEFVAAHCEIGLLRHLHADT